MEDTDSGIQLAFADKRGGKQERVFERLLVAVGRKPNTDRIGLENTAIETDRGFIPVNPYMETAEMGVYAIGDIVAGSPQLAHVASAEGMLAAARIAGKPAEPIDYNLNPNCTYCEPQIASVGQTEAQARAAGHRVVVSKFPFAANSKASILDRHTGFVKIVADEEFGEILGVHILGPQATEVIHEARCGHAKRGHDRIDARRDSRASHVVGGGGRRLQRDLRAGDQCLRPAPRLLEAPPFPQPISRLARFAILSDSAIEKPGTCSWTLCASARQDRFVIS